MDVAAPAPMGQLAIRMYEHYPASGLPCCAHLLISSTAPLEAELKHHPGLLPDHSRAYCHQLKADISSYLQHVKQRGGQPMIKLVIRIHGFNVPLATAIDQDFEEASHKLVSDCKDLDPYTLEDFVLFVHYCWPSERIFSGGPLAWIGALPLPLRLLLLVVGVVMLIAGKPLMAPIALLMMVLALILLRAVVYFRDRDRAASFGVFDGVEMVRALHHILLDLLQQTGGEDLVSRVRDKPFSLSFIAHSMGSFVTTQLVRVLTDVFDAEADRHYWDDRPYGPFQAADGSPPPPASQPGLSAANPQSRSSASRIGDLFILNHLILASPDIPVWAITSGRSNYLWSCLRRFGKTYLLVNDADIVLRLASALANYFVFPSRTPMGGFRLGNLSIKERGAAVAEHCEGRYGLFMNAGMESIVVHGLQRSKSLLQSPFDCDPECNLPLTLLDCTDYQDSRCEGGLPASSPVAQRLLSAFTATTLPLRLLNYAATFFLQIVGRIDSHAGYFRGKFCLDLIYDLALCGESKYLKGHREALKLQLQSARIACLDLPGGAACRS